MSGQLQQQELQEHCEKLTAPQAEKWLWIFYSTSILSSLISMICMLIVWQHWTYTFDSCINFDCGCILYGVTTFSTFMGGEVVLCHYGAFGLVAHLFVAIILGFYHGYRTCIPRSLSEPRAIASTRNGQNRGSMECEVMVVGPRQRAPFKSWMTFCFLAMPFAGLAMIHAAVITDGYWKTCSQYRRYLVQLINPTGQELQVIHSRLNCGAILDFMDYIHPDAKNWKRDGMLDSGVLLQLSILFSWLNFFAWIAVLCLNAYKGRQRHKMRNESMCYCCC